MEKSMTQKCLDELMDQFFDLPSRDWKLYSPLTLAYLGDTVFDLVIRTMLVKQANTSSHTLHRKASSYVNATKQAALARAIRPELTEEEEGVRRRGRNAKPGHSAKNAEREDYLEATGLEALIGYLYLTGQYERLLQLIKTGLEHEC